MKSILTLIACLLMTSATLAEEYEITIEGPIKIRVTVVDTTPIPVPDPPPPPPPVDELPKLIEVGPGKLFSELHQIDPTAIPENAVIKLHWRAEHYRSKFAIVKPGATLEGVPGPAGQRPIISGENAKTHKNCPLPLGIQTVFVVCVSKIPADATATIKGLEIRDCWEADTFTNSAGEIKNHTGGAGLVRATAGKVTIEDCLLTEGITGLFSKSTEGHIVHVTAKDCELTKCGNLTGQADEVVYTEGETILDHVNIHNHRNPTTTGVHSRDGELEIINGSYVESRGITILSNTAEVPPLIMGGKIVDGALEIRDSVIFSTGPSRAIEMKFEFDPAHAKKNIEIVRSLIIKEMYKSEFKSLWLTLRHSSQSALIEDSVFVTCSNSPDVPATICYLAVGENELLTFKGRNQFIVQSPQKAPIPLALLGSVRTEPKDWQSTFANMVGDYPTVSKIVLDLIAEKTSPKD